MAKSLFNKVAGLRSTTLLKKETLAQVFSSDFCEIFLKKISCYYKELWRPNHLREVIILQPRQKK